MTPILYISTTADGHMGVAEIANRKKYFAKIGIDEKKIVDLSVSHTDKVKVVTGKDAGKFFEGYDALITKEKDLILGLRVADCLPIALFDPVTGAIGLVHAGWRELVNGIIPKTINEMEKKWKVENDKLEIYIGAHICQKHYEIKSDVSDKFKDYPQAVKHSRGKIFLDLGLVAKIQLTKVGVKEENINIDPVCNFESKDLFSYRRGDSNNRNQYLLTPLR